MLSRSELARLIDGPALDREIERLGKMGGGWVKEATGRRRGGAARDEPDLRGEHQTPPARMTCQSRSWGRLPAAPSLCPRPQDNAKHDRLNPLA
jgi:hypothetical protein